ncbi:MAG: DUF2232 domain-containing protein [Pseudomonadota bacterium]
MFGLVQLAMRSRGSAVMVTSGVAGLAYAMLLSGSGAAVLLAFPVAALMYASAALVGLATLRNGPVEGGFMLLGVSVVVALGLALGAGAAMAVVGLILSAWLPTLMAALWLARTKSQGQALAFVFGLTVVAQVLLFAIVGDPAAQMEPWFREQWDAMRDAMRQSLSGRQQTLDVDPREVARSVAQMMMSSWALGVVLSLLLARWWHARLDNPGGFGTEFRELRLPRWLALAGIALLAGTSLVDGAMKTFLGGLSQVALLMFLFQGLAVAHGMVHQRGASRSWLIGMYILLFILMPMSLMVIALTGFIDHWLDYRRRAAST